jgi:hypothetical protein
LNNAVIFSSYPSFNLAAMKRQKSINMIAPAKAPPLFAAATTTPKQLSTAPIVLKLRELAVVDTFT